MEEETVQNSFPKIKRSSSVPLPLRKPPVYLKRRSASHSVRSLTSLQQRTREFLKAQRLDDFAIEVTRMLVIDSRLPLSIALKSLFHYRKNLLSIFSEEKEEFIGIMSRQDWLDFCLGVIDSHERKGEKFLIAGSSNEQLNCEKFRSTFSHSFLKFTNFDSQLSGAHNYGLEDISGEAWIQMTGKSGKYPKIGEEKSFLDGVNSLIAKEQYIVAVWSHEKESPLSFLTTGTILAHLVQNLRGYWPEMYDSVVSDLNIGVIPDEFPHCKEDTPLICVMKLLAKTRGPGILVFSSDMDFMGVFTASHFLWLLSVSLQRLAEPEASMCKPSTSSITILSPSTKIGVLMSDLASVGIIRSPVNQNFRNKQERSMADYYPSYHRSPSHPGSTAAVCAFDLQLQHAISHCVCADEGLLVLLHPIT
eukprot:GHVP01027926.1.p1 GENE.GHVP01027926.1~~GHVP01027926.1.p1  ORF type:complete len:429 (-),score=56.07 GHVP01027926.1:1441-2697(-)